MPSLKSYLVDWLNQKEDFPSSVGYYVHRGYVYLTGQITNITLGPEPGETVVKTTKTVFSELPVAIRPTVATKLTFPINPMLTDDWCDPEWNLPWNWGATVHPDGTLTLDILPSQINTVPPVMSFDRGSYTWAPIFPSPAAVTLVIANARWPIAASVDTYTSHSLTAFLSGEYSGTATYSPHGSRVHLAGKLTALGVATLSGDEFVLEKVPNPGEPPIPASILVSGESTTARAVIAASPYIIGLRTGTNGTTRGLVGPKAEEQIEQQDCRLVTYSDPMRAVRTDGPLLSDSAPSRHRIHGRLGTEEGVEPVKVRTGNSTIPGNLEQQNHARVENGLAGPKYVCISRSGEITTEVECNAPKSIDPVTIDLQALVETIVPPCDWFTVDVDYSVTSEDEGRGHVDCDGEEGILEEPPLAGTCGGRPGQPANTGEYFVTGGGFVSGPGFLGRKTVDPPAALYPGAAKGEDDTGRLFGLDSTRLWRRDQAIGTSLTFITADRIVGKGSLQAVVQVQPYWKLREFGLTEGDQLDLAGTGWSHATGSPGIGTTVIGEVGSGVVARED